MIEICPNDLNSVELILGEPACNDYWQRYYWRRELPLQDLERIAFDQYIPVYFEENVERRALAPSILKKMPPPHLPPSLPVNVPIRYFREPDWSQAGGDMARVYYDLKVLHKRGYAYCSTIFLKMSNGKENALKLLPKFELFEFVYLKLTFKEPDCFSFLKDSTLILLPCFNHIGTYVDDGRGMAWGTVKNNCLCITVGETQAHMYK